MLDKIVESYLYKLNKDNQFTEIQLEKIKYAFLAIWGDLSKFALLLMIFGLLDYHVEYLYAYITTCCLRIYIGGKHLKTYFGCLMFSFTYFYLLIKLSELFISYDKQTILLPSIVSTLVILWIAPQLSRKSGRKLKISIYKVKLIALIFATIYIVLYLINERSIYTIGPITLIIQTIQIIIMKGENYYETIKERKGCT